jgi:hypothetical protein
VGFSGVSAAGIEAALAGGTIGGGLAVNGGLTLASGDFHVNEGAIFSGTIETFSANIQVKTAGYGITIAEGANAKLGSGTLSGGTVTIANTSVTAASIIFLTDTSNGANLGVLSVGVITAGDGFVVNSSNALDSGTFNFLIIG